MSLWPIAVGYPRNVRKVLDSSLLKVEYEGEYLITGHVSQAVTGFPFFEKIRCAFEVHCPYVRSCFQKNRDCFEFLSQRLQPRRRLSMGCDQGCL
jgi:hypothetical protein